jgi:hypothetical protein
LESLVTDLAFPARRRKSTHDSMSPVRTTAVAGILRAAGADGVFTGTYRLERLVDQYGQSAAVGVFAGTLTSGDGERLGMGSRRHTAAAESSSTPNAIRVDIGPVDIVVLGFEVTVDAFSVIIPRNLPGPQRTAELPVAADGSSATSRR